MTDVLTPAQRRYNMSQIRSTDTAPELMVRKLLHSQGYRYRLHRGDLPGRPDIVLPRYRTVILVHGCFWHRHRCRSGQVVPATRQLFWKSKFERTIARDLEVHASLRRLGWKVAVVWECETRDRDALHRHLNRILRGRD